MCAQHVYDADLDATGRCPSLLLRYKSTAIDSSTALYAGLKC